MSYDIIDYAKTSNVQPEFSLFIPFTREWVLEDFLKNLDTLFQPLQYCEAIFYNDTDNRNIQNILYNYLKNSAFLEGRVYMSKNPAPTETNVAFRRQRIVDMKNKSRELISNSNYTICLEDDTFPQKPDTIVQLLRHIEGQENVGFVSGVERGRWGFNIIGAWRMDDVHNTTKMWTLPYKKEGLEEVDGGGMYCYVTPTNLYKNTEYHFGGECEGPDVMYVKDLRKRGYDCYVDWSLVCGHKTQSNLLLPDENCNVVTYEKTGDLWEPKSLTPSKDL